MIDEPVGLTPTAASKLLEIRSEAAPFLRVYVAGQGCCRVRYGLAFTDSVMADDTVAELLGVPVVVSAESRDACAGATIDYVDSAAGTGFTVTGPRTGSGCTCGGADRPV